MNQEKLTLYTRATMLFLLFLVTLPLGLVYGQSKPTDKKTTVDHSHDGHDHSGHDHSGHSHGAAPQSTSPAVLENGIKWFTIEEAYELNKINSKPFFVDVYTDWCGWCKKMDATTFQDANVAAYLNAYFYPVKLNAETKDTISFLEKKFYNSQDAYVKDFYRQTDSLVKIANDSMMQIGVAKNAKDSATLGRLANVIREKSSQKMQMQRQASRTTHDLARDLMNGQMSYPTFVILFDSLKHNFPLKGFQQPLQLLSVLSFFTEGIYKQTNDLALYQQEFSKTFSGGSYVQPSFYTNFMTALPDSVGQKKKTLVLITDDRYYSSQILEKSSILDPEVQEVLKSNFHVITLNLMEKDSIVFKGNAYFNKSGVHDLAAGFLQNETKLPLMVILDQNQNLISKVPGYFLPADLKPIFLFFAQNAYQSMEWPEYKKQYLKNNQ